MDHGRDERRVRKVDAMNAVRLRARGAGRGQAITELALIVPVIVVMLFGIVVISGAYNAKSSLQTVIGHADRIGAVLGNNNVDVFSCPANGNTGSISDTVDLRMVQAILKAPDINANNISDIQIYKAGVMASSVTVSNGIQLLNDYTSPFTLSVPNSTTVLLNAKKYYWPSCTRRSAEPSDSIAIKVSYTYVPILQFFGRLSLPITDQSVERINPTKNDNPCPVPNAPAITAVWQPNAAPAPALPSAGDTITVTGSSDTTRAKVYASSDGNGTGTTLVGAITGAGGAISNWNHTAVAPAGYSVFYSAVGNNFCGNGDTSDFVSNGAPPPLPGPVITPPVASTGVTDTVRWTAATGAVSYSVLQTVWNNGAVLISSTAVISAPPGPPPAQAVISDTYWTYASPTNPVTLTYQIAATNAAAVTGTFGLPMVFTPTVPAAPSIASGLVGWWPCDETTGITTADAALGLHTGTLSGVITRTQVTVGMTFPFTNYLTFNGSTGYITTTVSQIGTNLPATKMAQTISWWMNPDPSMTANNAASTVIALANTSNGSQGYQIGFHNGYVGVWLANSAGSFTGTNVLSASVTSLPYNSLPSNWHHYVLTFDGTSTSTAFKLYIDPSQQPGQTPVATGTNPWSASQAPQALTFAASPKGATTVNYYKGSLDDVRIYNQALTLIQIESLDKQE